MNLRTHRHFLRNGFHLICLLVFVLLGALPAAAWGPQTELSIITTAVHLCNHSR